MSNTRKVPMTMARIRREQMGARLRDVPGGCDDGTEARFVKRWLGAGCWSAAEPRKLKPLAWLDSADAALADEAIEPARDVSVSG